MQARPRLSVVVPVYNVERFLRVCLDSLFLQGLNENEYEIILVNDGSTDNSLSICEEYQKSHQNIIILSQENQGVYAARNNGIRKARGEWVCFVDSDDYINPNSYSYLIYHFCDKQYDVIRFWTQIQEDANIHKEQDCTGDIKFEGTGHEFIKQYGLDTFCIAYFYKKEFLENHHILFSPYIIGEDFLFASTVLLANPKLCSTSCRVYQYLIHPNSASTKRSTEHVRKCTLNQLSVNHDIYGMISRYKHEDTMLYDKCIETLQSKIPMILSRMSGSNITLKEFKEIVKKEKELGILPVKYDKGYKGRIIQCIINTLCATPALYNPAKHIYQRLFVPYVLPKMNRNK